MDDANVATDTGGDVTLLEDSRDAMALEDTRVADGMPIDSRADAPKDADAGPTCGSPGLACCAGESGDASDVGTGCGAYLTCSSGDGGTSTCRGCVAELANGYEYSCARRNDGTAWCWGYVWTPGKTFPDPERIGDFTKVTNVTVGFHHGCLINDGKVHCWGSNSVGQITGAFGGSYSWLAPTEVTLAAPATKVTAGTEHTCALLTDSSIWCWGENRQGQLGNGTKVMPAPPTKVIGLPAKVLDVEAGLSLGCAYLEDNSIWCWGDGAVGITQTATPIKLGTVADVARMKVEYGIYLVTKTGGLFRQLTSGSFGPLTEFGADIVQIASGQYHTCALRRDGTVGCKGNNSSGQLGNGSISNSDIVVEAWKLGKNNVEIVCGRYLTCARDQWGAVLCAGDKSGSASAGRLKLACP